MIHDEFRITKERCRYCGGTGWIMMQKPGHVDHNGVIYLIELPQPCLACETGRALFRIQTFCPERTDA